MARVVVVALITLVGLLPPGFCACRLTSVVTSAEEACPCHDGDDCPERAKSDGAPGARDVGHEINVKSGGRHGFDDGAAARRGARWRAGRRTSSAHSNLSFFRAQKPICQQRHQADDERSDQCRLKTIDVKALQQPAHQVKQEGVNDEHEKAQSEDQKRQ